jgi:hypothetical protein
MDPVAGLKVFERVSDVTIPYSAVSINYSWLTKNKTLLVVTDS